MGTDRNTAVSSKSSFRGGACLSTYCTDTQKSKVCMITIIIAYQGEDTTAVAAKMNSSDRFSNPEYINWLKLGICLMEIKPLLSNLIEEELKRFHEKLKCAVKEKWKDDICCSSACSIEKDQKLSKLCDICRAWSNVIKQNHKRPKSYIYWNNCKPSLWFHDALEVAKAYMPGRQADITELANFDISALVVLMKHCVHFENGVPETSLDKIQEIRNTLMHSAEMKISSVDAEIFFQNIFKCIDELKNSEINPLAKDILLRLSEKINQIHSSQLRIHLQEDLETEFTFVKEYVKVLCLETDESTMQKTNRILIERWQWFLQNGSTHGIAEHFRKAYDDLKEQYQKIHKKIDNMDGDIVSLDKRVTQLEDPLNPKKVVTYKNDLISMTQRKRWEAPVFLEETKNGGYVGKVTVNGVEYKGQTVHVAKVDSHQEAAKIALEHLSEQQRSVVKAKDTLLVAIKEVPFNDCDKKRFTSTVTCQIKGLIVRSSGRTREEAIQTFYRKSGLVLDILDQNSDTSHGRNALQEEKSSDLNISKCIEMEEMESVYELKLNGECQFRGQGDDKKQAQKNAAKNALTAFNQMFGERMHLKDSNNDYKGILQHFFQKRKMPLPVYNTHDSGIFPNSGQTAGCCSTSRINADLSNNPEVAVIQKNPEKLFKVSLTVKVKNVRIYVRDENNKEDAKQAAFMKLAFVLGAQESEENVENIVREHFSKSEENKLDIQYESTENKTFTCVLTITTQFPFVSQGSLSKSANQNAAKEALRRLAPIHGFQTDTKIPEGSYRNALQSLLQKAQQEIPTYKIIEDNAVEEFVSTVTVSLKNLPVNILKEKEYESEDEAVNEAYNQLSLVLNSSTVASNPSDSKERVLRCLGKDSVKETICKVQNRYRCQLILNTSVHFTAKESATTKSLAEQDAARLALMQLKPLFPLDTSDHNTVNGNYKGALQEILQQLGQDTPSYSTKSTHGLPESENPFLGKESMPPASQSLTAEDEKTGNAVEDLAKAMQELKLEKKMTHLICQGYLSLVTVTGKNIPVETLDWYSTEEAASNESYKILGSFLYSLGEISDKIETKHEIKSLFEMKKVPHPNETVMKENNKFKCCLSFCFSFSFKGYGTSEELAKEAAAKEAITKMATLKCIEYRAAETYMEELERCLINEYKYEETSSTELYSGSLQLSFRDFTVKTKQKHPSKKLAQKEICEKLAGVLAIKASDKNDKTPLKNRIQIWFQREIKQIPEYVDTGSICGDFGCHITFTADILVTQKDPQPSLEELNEILCKSALQRLKYVL
ncbi:uncharacterized protein LOC136771775 [Amia ocellicauda]|uniref:uncharacterized protein LOC136771775 n=1 Tax=Amia ocellicauda TaxID=2972642 RepID=UPI003463AA6D